MTKYHKVISKIVILGSTVTALALIREAQSKKINSIIFDTQKGIAMKSRYPQRIILGNEYGEDPLQRLIQFGGDDTALIADCDRWLRFILRHRTVLQKNFAEILHPDDHVLSICLNKEIFLKWCEEEKLPSPVLYEIQKGETLKNIVYPVVIRPLETLHGLKTKLPKALEIYNERKLKTCIKQFDLEKRKFVICESVISPGIRQYSIGYARIGTGRCRMIISEKLRPEAKECKGGTYVVESPRKEVTNLAQEILERMNIFGIGEIEILHNDKLKKSWIIEVNPRPWVQFSIASGDRIDFLGFILNFKTGYRNTKRLKTDKPKKWLWFISDLYNCFSASNGLVRTGKFGVVPYIKTIFSANKFAVWSVKDPVPFIVETKNFLFQILNSIRRKL